MTDLQKEILVVFKSFAEICDKHDLKYFAGAGTLIGAIRHKGFIPWDDDLDLYMPLDDYRRFIAIAKNELPEKIAMFDGASADISDGLFLKLHKKNTMFTPLELLTYPDSYFGVYIDIFPYIGTPDTAPARTQFQKKLDTVIRNLHVRRVYNYGKQETTVLMKKYRSLLNQYNCKKSKYVVIGALPSNVKAATFTYPRASFESSKTASFEDTTIRVPVGYDQQLTISYGDYMTPPKASDRLSKHSELSLLDLHKSFESYAEEARTSHLLQHYRELFIEKFDIINRIPPLEDRIKIELRRALQETAEKERFQNPTVKTAIKMLEQALLKKLRR